MSDKKRFKTRAEFAEELGISRRTLYNLIKEAGLDLSRGLLSPETQEKIWTYINSEDEEDATEDEGDASEDEGKGE